MRLGVSDKGSLRKGERNKGANFCKDFPSSGPAKVEGRGRVQKDLFSHKFAFVLLHRIKGNFCRNPLCKSTCFKLSHIPKKVFETSMVGALEKTVLKAIEESGKCGTIFRTQAVGPQGLFSRRGVRKRIHTPKHAQDPTAWAPLRLRKPQDHTPREQDLYTAAWCGARRGLDHPWLRPLFTGLSSTLPGDPSSPHLPV